VRAAPDALVVDASILISAVLGRSMPLVGTIGESVPLITTERAVAEAARRLVLGLRRPNLLAALASLVDQLEVVPGDDLEATIPVAAEFLRDANQSRNGSTTDAHIVALAWKGDADIWSHDRDFAGTGIASWSSINLVRAVTERPRSAPDV
jgi:predicted nucleic acid-binding protein